MRHTIDSDISSKPGLAQAEARFDESCPRVLTPDRLTETVSIRYRSVDDPSADAARQFFDFFAQWLGVGFFDVHDQVTNVLISGQILSENVSTRF